MKRPYRLGLREATVRRHRARILNAARKVFSEAGYHGAVMEEVALRAGVSRKTVYYQFGSKLGILDALLSDLEAAAELGQRVQLIMRKPARHALAEYFREVCLFWNRNQAVMRVIIGLAATDADARKVVEMHDGARRRRLESFVRILSGRGELAKGYPKSLAIDLMWLLSSFASYEHLVQRSHLSLARAADLLADAASVLIAPSKVSVPKSVPTPG